MQTLYTSGTVFHAFLGEKLPDWKAAAKLVRTIAENYRLPYYTMSPTYSICKEHGYLAGEQKYCPKCGKVTEVYSRITGYYRPVQNWNDGKLQEYKNRTEYVVGNNDINNNKKYKDDFNKLNFQQAIDSARKIEKNIEFVIDDEEISVDTGKPMLFTTKTCPNCRLAKEFLKGIDYTLIDAEENMELASEYGVMQAPTLVVVNGQSRQKYVNVSDIKKYTDFLKCVTL